MSCFRPLVLCLVALVGCQDKEVPEHIQQQQQQQQQQRERRRQQKEAVQRQIKAGKVPSTSDQWTLPVRRAVMQIYRGKGLEAARTIHTLAHLGPTSAAALQHIAGSVAMDQRKQILASLVLVELRMFQPVQLAELCHAHELPFVQHAAVEALGRLGNPKAERLLKELTPELSQQPVQRPGVHSGHAHAGTNRPLRPLADVLHKAKDRSRKWWYNDKQLVILDRILQADSPDKLLAALAAVTDRTLEKGLRGILASSAARPPVKAALAHRIVELDKDRPKLLKSYCNRRESQLLRLAAARRLIDLGQRDFLQKLSQAVSDPLAPVLTRMLQEAPKPAGSSAPR